MLSVSLIILILFVFLDTFKFGVECKVTTHYAEVVFCVPTFNEVEGKNNFIDLRLWKRKKTDV